MSDGIGEWYKARREHEMRDMSPEERAKYLAPRPRPEQKVLAREMNGFNDLTDANIIYEEPPHWRRAIDSILDTLKRQRETVPVVSLCAVSFFLGYWVGSV